MTNNQKLQEVESVVNGYSKRAAIITCDEQLLLKLDLLIRSIKEGYSKEDVLRVINVISGIDSDGMYFLKKTCVKAVEDKSKYALNNAMKIIDKYYSAEEGAFLCSIVKNQPEKVDAYLAKKTPIELEKTMANVANFYKHKENTRFFGTVNKVLAYGNKKIKRKVMGIEGVDKTKLSEDENSMIRSVFCGAFHIGNGDITHSKNYLDWTKGSIDNAVVDDYNLLKNNPLLKMVKDSYNIQQVAPEIDKKLKSLKMPVYVANELNVADLASIMGEGGNAYFGEISKKTVLSPRAEFCQKLVSNRKVIAEIKNDFISLGASEEFFEAWLSNMNKRGDSTLNIKGFERDSKLIDAVDVHHKNPVSSALTLSNPLKINDQNNFIFTVGKKAHTDEHISDKKYCSAKISEDNKVLGVFDSKGEKGDYAFEEYLEHGNDNRVYKSNYSLCEDSSMQGNTDLEKGMENKIKMSINIMPMQKVREVG